MTEGKLLIEPVRAFLSAPHCAVLSTIGAGLAGQPRVGVRIDVERLAEYD